MGSFVEEKDLRLKRSHPLPVVIMLVAVVWVYWCPNQMGGDYLGIHQYRMQFAREALLGPNHYLPGWFPREALGTPFWSNMHSFPLIPWRLIVLGLFDPRGIYAFTFAATLSAVLSSSFAYLYCRRIGCSAVAAAAGGFTFACSAFYASRVNAGHLPLLEAYCGLPLLLWMSESLFQALQHKARSGRIWMLLLALSVTAVCLAGHPQLPIYSLVTCIGYLLMRGGMRFASRAIALVVLGIGCAGVALVPMAMLVARSSRMLHLAHAENDFAMPLWRLSVFFVPWMSREPDLLKYKLHSDVSGAFYWDTCDYTGWLPWLAVALLGFMLFRRAFRNRINRVGIFFVLLGLGSIALSMNFGFASSPGVTFLRSPARILYCLEFVLAVALAVGIDLFLSLPILMIGRAAILGLALVVHFLDLVRVDRSFIVAMNGDFSRASVALWPSVNDVGDHRVAIDAGLPFTFNRELDDVGFTDSIILSRFYQAIISLAGKPADSNIESLDGSELPLRALRATGVSKVITTRPRNDLKTQSQLGTDLRVYSVPDPDPRALLVEDSAVDFISRDEIHRKLRDSKVELASRLAVPKEFAFAKSDAVVSGNLRPSVIYQRIDSDRIKCTTTCVHPSVLRLLETCDTGWSVTVDGKSARVIAGWDVFLAVEIPVGVHQIQFEFHTPGAHAGLAVSVASLIGLLSMVVRSGLSASD